MAELRNGRNVLRYEHHHFRGWVVALKGGGKILDVRYFKDGRGGRRRPVVEPSATGTRLFDRFPPPVKLKTPAFSNFWAMSTSPGPLSTPGSTAGAWPRSSTAAIPGRGE